MFYFQKDKKKKKNCTSAELLSAAIIFKVLIRTALWNELKKIR